MQIDFAKLKDEELCALIAAAVVEQQARLALTPPKIIRRQAAVMPEPQIIVIDEPPKVDKQFALHIKTMMLRGLYVKSDARSRYYEIAKKYPAWIKQQELPADTTGSSAKKWANLYVIHKPTQEL